jgi:hypothetical protein
LLAQDAKHPLQPFPPPYGEIMNLERVSGYGISCSPRR